MTDVQQRGPSATSQRADPVKPDDPAFPRLHGRPTVGWVNDPNGLCRVDGRYHVFFQHNPHRPRHRDIHWGHVSSTDLVTWRHEPVALAPRPGEIDAHGCWSGCMVVDGDTPTAVYSAVADDNGRSAVVLARSHDGLATWTADLEPVAGMPDDPTVTDMRDPFVFTINGHRYAVQGAGSRRGDPALLVHACDDLDTWTPLGKLLDGDDPIAARIAPANVWECPNLFQLDNRWVLIVSLWENLDDRHTLSGVRWLLGDLDLTDHGPRFRPTSGGVLDDGPCFYAPQVLPDGDRVLLWAWSWEHGRRQPDIDAAGWAGTLTYPRELALVDDVVASRPAPELAGLRRERLEVTVGQPFAADAFELALPPGERVHLRLDDAPPHQDSGSAAGFEVGSWRIPDHPISPPRLLIDGSLVEVFPGGPTSYTTRAYPSATSHWSIHVGDSVSTTPAFVRGWTLGLP